MADTPILLDAVDVAVLFPSIAVQSDTLSVNSIDSRTRVQTIALEDYDTALTVDDATCVTTVDSPIGDTTPAIDAMTCSVPMESPTASMNSTLVIPDMMVTNGQDTAGTLVVDFVIALNEVSVATTPDSFLVDELKTLAMNEIACATTLESPTATTTVVDPDEYLRPSAVFSSSRPKAAFSGFAVD